MLYAKQKQNAPKPTSLLAQTKIAKIKNSTFTNGRDNIELVFYFFFFVLCIYESGGLP